ncbi:hypothetical protein BB560_004588 [Smittium megazygosporum]|uniref:Ubiquitin-like protease family profile domain-containing protein n=1 Tax=Smittium megazygosporum TaxID=133381 RepID=A0A2T9Z8T7_9FUNG|nr:hypothetical protein BB560_004588 [Smittium megazygosporum]
MQSKNHLTYGRRSFGSRTRNEGLESYFMVGKNVNSKAPRKSTKEKSNPVSPVKKFPLSFSEKYNNDLFKTASTFQAKPSGKVRSIEQSIKSPSKKMTDLYQQFQISSGEENQADFSPSKVKSKKYSKVLKTDNIDSDTFEVEKNDLSPKIHLSKPLETKTIDSIEDAKIAKEKSRYFDLSPKEAQRVSAKKRMRLDSISKLKTEQQINEHEHQIKAPSKIHDNTVYDLPAKTSFPLTKINKDNDNFTVKSKEEHILDLVPKNTQQLYKPVLENNPKLFELNDSEFSSNTNSLTSAKASSPAQFISAPNLTVQASLVKVGERDLYNHGGNEKKKIELTLNLASRTIKAVMGDRGLFDIPLIFIKKLKYSSANDDVFLVLKALSDPPESYIDDFKINSSSFRRKSFLGANRNSYETVAIRLDMTHTSTQKVVRTGIFYTRLVKLAKGTLPIIFLTPKEHSNLLNMFGNRSRIDVTLSSDSETEPPTGDSSNKNIQRLDKNEDREARNEALPQAEAKDSGYELEEDTALQKPSFKTLDVESTNPQKRSARIAGKNLNLNPHNDSVLLFKFPFDSMTSIPVSSQDYTRLGHEEFLNDSLIDFYLRYLMEHLQKTNKKFYDQIFIYSSFFYDLYCKHPKHEPEKRFDSVRKWTSKVDIFAKKYLFVPINKDYHWFLALIVNPSILTEFEKAGTSLEEEIVSTDKATQLSTNLNVSKDQNEIDGTRTLSTGTGNSTTHHLIASNSRKNSDNSESQEMDVEICDEQSTHSQDSYEMSVENSETAQDFENENIVSLTELTQLTTEDFMDSNDHSEPESVPVGENTDTKKLNIEKIDIDEMEIESSKALSAENDSQNSTRQGSIHVDERRTSPRLRISPIKKVDELIDEHMVSKYWFPGNGTRGGQHGLSANSRNQSSKSTESPLSANQESNYRNNKNCIDPDSRPWIIIFDSLGGRNKLVLENLNSYMRSLFNDKYGYNITGSIQGCYAKVPKQPNYSDCGVYLLQYVEEFMKKPDVLEKIVLKKVTENLRVRIISNDSESQTANSGLGRRTGQLDAGQTENAEYQGTKPDQSLHVRLAS